MKKYIEPALDVLVMSRDKSLLAALSVEVGSDRLSIDENGANPDEGLSKSSVWDE